MIKNIKIPKDRKRVIESCLKELKQRTKTNVAVKDNVVTIEGEALNVWETKDIIIAIGRGFSPMNSFGLLEDNKSLEVINLKKLCQNKKSIKRIKGRIIGRNGKCREKIEWLTGSKISVYGNTVSIISDTEKIYKIRNAIMMIVNGMNHNKVYAYLKRKDVIKNGENS